MSFTKINTKKDERVDISEKMVVKNTKKNDLKVLPQKKEQKTQPDRHTNTTKIAWESSSNKDLFAQLHSSFPEKARKLLDKPISNKPNNEVTGFYFYLGMWVIAVVLCFYLYPLAGWLLLVIGIILLALLIWMIIAIGKAIREATRNAARGCGNVGRSCSRCG